MSWPTSFGFPAETVTFLREQYVDSGAVRGPLCDTACCCCVATVRVVAWPVLPSEQHPVYCDYCAAAARMTLEALGIKYADELLPVIDAQGPVRSIVIGE